MSAERRLMDLLAGWADYVHTCEQSTDPSDTTPRDVYASECRTVYGLYQKTASVDELTSGEIETILGMVCQMVKTGRP